MGLIKDMRSMEHLTERERDIRDYILTYPDKIAKLSSRELSSITFTSPSSVTRFCQKLGCEGYQEFKLRFLSELKSKHFAEESEDIGVLPKENVISVMTRMVELQKKILDATFHDISLEQMTRISEMFLCADYIDFYVYDVNVALAKYASNQFFYCGKISNILEATNSQELMALIQKEKHLAVIISRTGENLRLVEIAKTLKKRKVPTVVITVDKKRSLGTMGDEVICVPGKGTVESLGTVTFSTSVKYVFDVLFTMMFSQKYEESISLNQEYEKVGRRSLWSLINDI